MIVDEVEVVFEAGHGGAGKVSFFKKGIGPDGGNGGSGGSIIIVGTSDLTALNKFASQKYFRAKDGEAGQSNQKDGRGSPDLEYLIPVGTEITDTETGEVFEVQSSGERLSLCAGGKGGLGNYALRSARNTTPMKAQTGLPGQRRSVKMILRFIADFGFVGLPNVGKTSLFNCLTNANAKVGNYPFTTLEPNLGMAHNGKILADIPGLISGAAEGKGLGSKFLKHIEKVKTIVHCIESISSDPVADYRTIRAELGRYNSILLEKPEVVILTKTDEVEKKKIDEWVKKLGKIVGLENVLTVSILDDLAIKSIKEKLGI